MAAKRPQRRNRAANEDLVSVYLADIARYRLLDRDDEIRLSQAIDAGNAARAGRNRCRGCRIPACFGVSRDDLCRPDAVSSRPRCGLGDCAGW